MTCTSCGRENREGAQFCRGCGGALAHNCSSCGAGLEPDAGFCDSCGQQVAAASTPAASLRTPAPAPALPDSLAAGRYAVKRFLGEGGRKRVYLARDTRLDRDVAIAMIKTEGLDADALARVQREAQAMGRLGDHPHIVTIHDIGDEDASQAYIVSQYMEGGDLEGLLREADRHQLPVDQTLRLGEQVCRALEHAHSRGVVHRDLKPANIWLTRDGTAKLGDFGLAVALDRSRLTMEGMILGTVAYMAPEQALGRQSDARSDLYSLGCVLYEALTGRPPFLGEDAVGVISQHVNTPPIAISWHNPNVPPALDGLVMQLLAKVPEDRPSSAAEVADALASIAAAADQPVAEQAPAASSLPGQLRGYRRALFVGREKEMAKLKERFEGVLSGQGSLVMIVGEPGIGKTRLAEELSVYARLRGAQALSGQCYETEGAPPYIPFVEALRQYVNSRPVDALREEMGEGASDLAKLVSEIRVRVPDIPSSPAQEPETERYRLLEAVTSFLVNASKANPLLLILDDLHWADRPSLLLLEHVARRLSGARLLIVGTYRDVELDRRHPLSEVIAGLRRERLYERVLLRGLDREGVRALLGGTGAMTGSNPEQSVNPALTNAVYEQTEGNPFFIEEIMAHLVEVGALYRKKGQWQIRLSALAEQIPEGIREVIGRRLSRLGAAANEALSFASVVGRDFDFDVLQALSEMEEEALLSALEGALAAQLINEQKSASGTSYRFSHALVQETLYGELSIARKQRLHLRAGRALEQARAGHLEPYVGQLAYHFHQGNEPEKAIEYAGRAGDAALHVYAWEQAIRHWEVALELMEERGGHEQERVRIMERLGDVTYTSGIDFEKGVALLERALELYEKAGNRTRVGGIHSRLGRAMVSFIGRVDSKKGFAHLEAAISILEEDAPDSAALVYAYLGVCQGCSVSAQGERGLDYAQRAMAIAEKLSSRPVTCNAYLYLGFFLASSGSLREGFDLMEKSWHMADEDNLTLLAFTASFFYASLTINLRRDPSTAKMWLQRELAKPRAASAPMIQEYLSGRLGNAHIIAGEMDEARLIRDGGNRFPFFHSAFRIASGDWEAEEEDRLAEREQGVSSGNQAMAWGGSIWLGEMSLRRGEYARAEEYLRECRAIEETQAVQRAGRDSSALLARLLAKTGRPDEAQQEIDLLDDLLTGPEDWGGRAGLLALASAVVLAARRKWGEAEAAFEQALTIARRYGLPWDEADALHERALMHLARDEENDRKEALRLLDETMAIYQRLGAKKHLELVLADKLKAQGIDPTDVHTSIDRVTESVREAKPDLRPHAAPDGTVTIMFSDIEGSTAMTERLGDKVWMEVLRQHNAIVRDKLKAHGGFEVKSEGDGFMVAFGSARRALDCAMAIQSALAERNASLPAHPEALEGRAGGSDVSTSTAGDGAPVRVRMGLHTGEAIKEGEDFFGKNVILAARIASQATGGEIMVSGLLKALVESAGDIRFAEGREVELKGLSGRHEIWPVVWGAS